MGERRRNITGDGQDQKLGYEYRRVVLSAANSVLMHFPGWGVKLCLEIQDWEDTRDDALTFKGSAVLAGSNYSPVVNHEMVKLSMVSPVAICK